MAHFHVMSTVSVLGDHPMKAELSRKHGDLVSITFGHANDLHLILDLEAFERLRAVLATVELPVKEAA